MRMKLFALAAGLVLASAGTALAAPGRATADLNLRSGPGTAYRVIDTMPAGAVVDIRGCRGAWCRVAFEGATGYAAANLLSGPAVGYVARPAPAYVYGAGPGYWAPDDVYDDGPDYGFAYDPGFSVGFGFGGFHHGYHRGLDGGFHGAGFHHGGYHGGGHHR